MSESRTRITEAKLQRKDYFRAQTQFKSRKDKITWAAEYNFIAECYPEIAESIRDYLATETIKKLKEHFRTVLKSNPKAKPQFGFWLMESVIDSKLLREIERTVYKDSV